MLEALRSGKINPEKLIEMETGERRTFFEGVVGKENAFDVNALFESKLLLKDQKRGLVRWAKQITGLKEPVRKDLITKIEKMEKVLDSDLIDLAAKKLGTRVSIEEMQEISKLTKEAVEARDAIKEDSPNGSPERLEYGLKSVLLQEYVDALKLRSDLTYKEWIKQEGLGEITLKGADQLKSLRSMGDISFSLRQGLPTLLTHPTIWWKGFSKQFADIGAALGGKDPLRAVRAEVISRKNALNGKYQAGKFDLGVIAEEAFPATVGENIPVFGRISKASEAAYTGMALRLRAELADMFIEKAEASGMDLLHNASDARSVGTYVNSLTGRGNIGRLGASAARGVNSTFFSPRFAKSRYDILTGHRFGFALEKGQGREFVRKRAAEDMAKIIGGVAVTLYIAKQLGFDVELDPRSTKAGQICYKDTCFDVTGGIRGFATLASRVITQSTKSAGSGKVTELNTGRFGSMTVADVLLNFAFGKLSPAAGLIRDAWLRGEDYSGEKFSLKKSLLFLPTPITFESIYGMKEEEASIFWAALIAEELGISTTQYK